MTTLADATDDFFTKAKNKGGTCPCCQRWGKINKRPFHKSLAGSIVWLVQAYIKVGYTYIDVPANAPRAVIKSREFDKLEAWQLAVRRANTNSSKRDSGFWAPTQLGADFAAGKVSIPKYAYMYNMRAAKAPLKFDPPQIFIGDIVKPFDYNELMAGKWPW